MRQWMQRNPLPPSCKKALFLLVTINRNSYEPQWCQRSMELQNRLVEASCFAGARGKSRRDLPSSRTTAGHRTAESIQTETAFGKLISRGSQRASKPVMIHRFPARQSCVNRTTLLCWPAAVRLMELSHCTQTAEPISTAFRGICKHEQ